MKVIYYKHLKFLMVVIICNQIYFLHMMKVKKEVIQRNCIKT